MADSCIPHKVVQRDTLQRLATVYAVSSWTAIAYLNGLQYPFILDEIPVQETRLSNIAYLGDTILIPTTSETTTEYLSDLELQKRTYGTDILLNFGISDSDIQSFEENQGQLVNDSNGDISQAIGAVNVKQALILRLSTRYGELPMHLDYGSKFPDMIGLPKTVTNLAKMKLEVMETFKKDLRVSDVTNCVIISITKGISITCNIILVAPNSSFVFNETITG